MSRKTPTAAALSVRPFLQDVERGVFATRSPRRPNPIGLSMVRLLRRRGAVLHVEGVDVLDGTPRLDIKPVVHRFDRLAACRSGWQEEVEEETAFHRGSRNAPRGRVPAVISPSGGRKPVDEKGK